jgi:hypothetical protein
MPEEIQTQNITISGVEDTGNQIKIRDQNRKTYSFFKTKKDGGETEAYKNYQRFKVGDKVLLTFKEVPYKDGSIKNVMTFKEATGEPEPAPPRTNNYTFTQRASLGDKPGREYWEQREQKRQSSILMQVAFKSAVAMEAARIQSGAEEDRERLYNTTLEYYDWMAEQIGEVEQQKSESVLSHAHAETLEDVPF